jgi:hypothetical protein
LLNEDAVRRLLARASELEAARVTQLSIAELREVAKEAGIAPSALEEALVEFRNRSQDANTDATKPETKGLSRLKAVALGALITFGLLGAALLALLLLRGAS